MTTFRVVRDDGNGHRSEIMFEADSLAEVARFASEKSGQGAALDLGIGDLGLDGDDLL